MPTPDSHLYRAASQLPYFSADADTYFTPTPLRDLRKQLPLRVLTEQDFAHWQNFGYIVVKQAIPSDAAARLLEFTWEFQGLDPDDPESWYAERPFRSELEQELHIYGFVEAYHHQFMWDSRQTQRVYDAFVDVWDCEELWVTLDRLNLNPPNVRNRDRALIAPTDTGFDIELHWDVDSTRSVPQQRVQGIIALNDTEPDLGGFQCCPELFHRFEQWKAAAPADRDPVRPAVDRAEFPVIRPQLQAGDLLIWNGLLAHGVQRNRSEKGVRAAQYLAMMPALESHSTLRQSRIDSWRTLSTPDWNTTLVGDATKHESLRYGPAELTEVGAKLLGLTSWHDLAAAAPDDERADADHGRRDQEGARA